MTFEQSQGHQTSNENVDPEQSYNQAKFAISGFNSVQEKGSIKGFLFVFFKQGNMLLSSLNVHKSEWYIIITGCNQSYKVLT